MRRRRNRRATASLKRLYKVFERSEASLVHSLPIRKTISGIWGPTPLRVIEEAISVLEDIGLLGEAAPQRIVVDAGTGDGRIPAVLAAVDPTRPVYGIEKDPALFAQADRFSSSTSCSGWLHETAPARPDTSLSCLFLKVATHPLQGFAVRAATSAASRLPTPVRRSISCS